MTTVTIEMNKADKLNIEKFILKIESKFFQDSISKQTLINKYDISIIEYLKIIIQDTKDLIAYGEYKIAIENLLSNLLEEKIIPTKDILFILFDIQDNDIKYLLHQLGLQTRCRHLGVPPKTRKY